MNVNYTDNVTNTIKSLRENIYSTDEFKNKFTSNLSKSIHATNTKFIPDQFGGWSVDVTIKHKNNDVISSMNYVGKIIDTLSNSIHEINGNASYDTIKNNLANVIVTGPDSLTVKI